MDRKEVEVHHYTADGREFEINTENFWEYVKKRIEESVLKMVAEREKNMEMPGGRRWPETEKEIEG